MVVVVVAQRKSVYSSVLIAFRFYHHHHHADTSSGYVTKWWNSSRSSAKQNVPLRPRTELQPFPVVKATHGTVRRDNSAPAVAGRWHPSHKRLMPYRRKCVAFYWFCLVRRSDFELYTVIIKILTEIDAIIKVVEVSPFLNSEFGHGAACDCWELDSGILGNSDAARSRHKTSWLDDVPNGKATDTGGWRGCD